MSQDAHQIYRELVRLAQTDANVLGFVLGGSRGKGFAAEHSDYDCVMIVADKARAVYAVKMRELPSLFDVGVYTLQEFAERAAWGGELAWDRYNWAHLRAQVDKTGGKIQALIDEKGKVPADEVRKFVQGELDHYINQVYRSIKCCRDGNTIGYRFEAADSVKPLLDVLFAVHDRRLRPYYKYLQWELTRFPLHKFSWTADQLLELLQTILADGSYRAQQHIFREVESVLRAEGYGEVFDSWGEELWIRDYPEKVSGRS
ncbi:MAG TPA: hypothetical protein VF546_15990 [Pyrinomonadaceae bacterium]|jgi:hypothetical protein